MKELPKGYRLYGKVAVITGAAGGIGEAVAAKFAEEGARVICIDSNEGALATSVRLLQESGHDNVTALAYDVTDAKGMIRDAMSIHGTVDVLHANAAVQVMGNLEVTGPADWDRMYAVNQRAVAESIKEVAPHMRRNGQGSIILTSSLLGLTGDPDLPMYGATKGALRALCRSVATALGPDNIRCNTICPADIDTPMVREFFNFQPDPARARTEIEQHYPLRRIGTPSDVANAAIFLASDESAFITGTDLIVDGGLLARIY